MIDSAAAVPGCAWAMDAGRRTAKCTVLAARATSAGGDPAPRSAYGRVRGSWNQSSGRGRARRGRTRGRRPPAAARLAVAAHGHRQPGVADLGEQHVEVAQARLRRQRGTLVAGAAQDAEQVAQLGERLAAGALDRVQRLARRRAAQVLLETE
jgi:hypothetical protein